MSSASTGRSVREVDTPTGTMRVLVSGDGAPVLYLHGVGDTGGPSALVSRLARDHTVIRPDHPGFLGSDPLGCTTVADVAERHVALLDALGVDRCTVLGASFGGWVAAELALLAPERVAGVILVDPAGLRGPERAPDLYALDAAAMMAFSFHRPELKADAERLDDAAGEVLRGNLAAARRVAPTMSAPGLAGRLTSLALPTTLVWGVQDEIFPVSYAEEWLRALPHARLELIEGSGHLPHVERLEEFWSRIGPALAESPGGVLRCRSRARSWTGPRRG